MTEQEFQVRRMAPAIGAKIEGVDLSERLDEQTLHKIHDALIAHGVIFFRNQVITPANLRDFAARFGRLNIHPYLPKVEGIPELTLLENDHDRPPAVNLWHSDLLFLEEPPLGAVLYAHHVPPCGGDTLWANTYAAYEALSGEMQRFLSGLVTVNQSNYAAYRKALGDEVDVDEGEVRSAEHPLVRTHPVTGRKCLFMSSGATKYVKGLMARESDALLEMLFRHIQTPEFQVRFRWQRHSVAIWDNRCTQHYAVADYWPERRVMFRAAIEGDRPY
jgi:taurine dioxygenase